MEPSHPQLMARYNRWMNERVYALLKPLDDAERKRDRGAFFGSIHDTLDHIHTADLIWMARFEGLERPPVRIGKRHLEGFADLDAAREVMDARIQRWAEGISSAWLDGDVTYRSGIDGKEHTTPAWLVVTHLFNHQTHHRGQVTTLMFQIGIDPGPTDIPVMLKVNPIRACPP